jgi:hypothetical protein
VKANRLLSNAYNLDVDTRMQRKILAQNSLQVRNLLRINGVIVYVPWVVLHELDSLAKSERDVRSDWQGGTLHGAFYMGRFT